MFDKLRRQLDDAYRDTGMTVGLPTVKVDASQLKHLLDHYDALNSKVSITDEEYELFQKMQKIWLHSVPERSGLYFICGEAGERDQMGLPEHILICPAYGSDGMAMYTMSKPYSAPGY